ncbi:uncharacterized protein LOC125501401 [Athalia rosae]|uniref:uncharacterized protein LOC125501401 n=1 Tax=Athalia rosae TaxID=37344 RepID=UPI0020349146|nr:uncharacterized protein LOC125501401 [Athalia rosae]
MARRITRRDVKRPSKIRKLKLPYLIISAIRNLRNTKGSPPTKIVSYVARTSHISRATAKRQVDLALRRAVNDGLLRRRHGHYCLDPVAAFFKSNSGKSSKSPRGKRAPGGSAKSNAPKKIKKNPRRIVPFARVVRKPLLSVRTRNKYPRRRPSPHQLSDMYCNPSYKDSTDSSVASSLSRKSSELQPTCDNATKEPNDGSSISSLPPSSGL